MRRYPSLMASVTGALLSLMVILPAAQDCKSVMGLAIASVKSINGLAIASVKAIGGVDNTASGGGFTYYSSIFDGTNDYLTRGANITGLSDGQAGLFSAWVKPDSGSNDASYMTIISNNNFIFDIYRNNSSGFVEILGKRASDAVGVLVLRTNTNSVIASSGWVHILASWDLGTAGRRYVYVNGSDQTNVTTFTTSETIDYARTNYEVGASTGGQSKWNGLMSEVYFTNTWLDISNSSNRALFRTAGGKPENLGADGSTPTGTQPLVYLHNSYTTFQTNLGSGGNFSVTGALTDGGADIP